MADTIITLGRGIETDGTLTLDSIARVEKAVGLLKQGIAPKIIMSGAYSRHMTKVPVQTEAKAMKKLAISLGCDPDDIIEESRSMHTLANAYFTKKLVCEPNGWHDLVVIASEEHMPRVKYVFNKVYGASYAFGFVQSDRVIDDEDYAKELEHESKSLELSHKWLDSIQDGNDQAIRELIASQLPDDPMAKSL